MFTSSSETTGRNQADITGLIGQYAHGNEPSHHMAYLYPFVGKHHRTAELVDSIRHTLYSPLPDGLSGNEDCGQMSAWYVWSALGMYPVTPGSNQLILGTPLFDEVCVTSNAGQAVRIAKQGEGEVRSKRVLPIQSPACFHPQRATASRRNVELCLPGRTEYVW